MIRPEVVERIKETARIEDVVGEFVQLKKRGANLLGLCPFHQEKTPSFSVNPARNIYKCFGCGRGGDTIDFLEEHEQLGYPEALRWLAGRYQIEIEEEEVGAEELAARDRRESLFIVSRFAAGWFEEQLHESGEGRQVGLAYFRERGFREATIREFGLGWCPSDGEAFTRAALEAGYRKEFLEELGLTRDRGGRSRDFFRERVVFPIHNLGGKVVGFGARTLRSDKRIPKYVNSPESEIYVKSRVLYGIHAAKREIIRAGKAFLVEGYTDVLAMHQAGVSNVVASSGTALTGDQIQLLRRYTTEVTILYDGDAAGVRAALRGTELILEQGMNVRIVVMPEGDDPDSLARRLGSEAFAAYLEEHAKDFVLFRAEGLLEESEGDPIRKASLVKDIVGTIAKVADPLTRSFYVKETARLMDVSEQLLLAELNKARRADWKKARRAPVSEPEVPLPPSSPPVQPGEKDEEAWQERALIRLLFDMEERELDGQPAVQAVLERVEEIELDHPLYARILQAYREGRKRGDLPVAADFLGHDDPQVKTLAIDLVHKPWSLSGKWEDYDIHITDPAFLVSKDVDKVVGYLKYRKLVALRNQLRGKLRDAPGGMEPALLKQLARVNEIIGAQAEHIGHFLVER